MKQVEWAAQSGPLLRSPLHGSRPPGSGRRVLTFVLNQSDVTDTRPVRPAALRAPMPLRMRHQSKSVPSLGKIDAERNCREDRARSLMDVVADTPPAVRTTGGQTSPEWPRAVGQ